MKKETITFRFNKFKNKSIGAIPTLSKAIRSMHFGKTPINQAFNKFVPKNEFAQDERDMILEDLYLKSSLAGNPESVVNNPLKSTS